MRKVGRFLSWFLLAPYFASWAVPMTRPLFTNNVELAKRWRAQGVIAFGMFIVLLSALSITGQSKLLASRPYLWAGLFSAVFGVLLTSFIGTVINRERERRLMAEYHSMRRWERIAFACTTWTFVAAMFLLMLWFGPTQHRPKPPWTNLRCDAKATEVTAETCSTAAQ